MQVEVSGIVEGGKWAQITTPDKRVGYFPANSLAANQVSPPASPVMDAANAELDHLSPIEFLPTSDVYTVTQSVPVYLEPNIHSPEEYQIEAGTSVPAIQRSKDGVWVLASTEDGEPAYLLGADLGVPQPGKAIVPTPDTTFPPASPTDSIEGSAEVVTTSLIEVGGQKVALFGVAGEGGGYAEQLQTIINFQGGTLHCLRKDQTYVCKLPTGIDIALSALFNGGARPTDDAPDAYQNQARAAKAAGRGVWGQH